MWTYHQKKSNQKSNQENLLKKKAEAQIRNYKDPDNIWSKFSIAYENNIETPREIFGWAICNGCFTVTHA